MAAPASTRSTPSTRSTRKYITADEFVCMPLKDDYPCELVRGRIIRERSYPKTIHGRLESRMAYLLESWMEKRNDGGAVTTNPYFIVATDPDTVRRPDVAYISADRIPESRHGTMLRRPGPELVVEVTSRSNTWTHIQERVIDYFGAGTRLIWVVDPPTRTVTVYRPSVQAQRLDISGELSGGNVLPGFAVRLDRLFRV